MQTPARRLLDHWGVEQGYANFDVYLQAGGSFLAAHDQLLRQAANIDIMLAYISNFGRPSEPELPLPESKPPPAGMTSVDWALATMEAEQTGDADEPPDPNNAQIQGFEEPDEQPHA